MVVYNLAGLAIGILAICVAITTDFYLGSELANTEGLLAGFAAMAVLGAFFEWRLEPARRPRYFWLFPAWLAGLVGAGLVVLDDVHLAGGVAILVAAALGFGVHVMFEMRQPGGRWVAWMVSAVTVLTAELGLEELLLDGPRPTWLKVVGGTVRLALLAVFLYATYRVSRARAVSNR